MPRLKALGHQGLGLDPIPSPTTDIVGGIEDRALVARAIRELRAEAVIHAGALHKPDIIRRAQKDFIAVNVEGTLNLLEEARAQGVGRFLLISTTSLMISAEIRAGLRGGASAAAWIDENFYPLEPRNIYGVSKLAAEHLCRLAHLEHGLAILILRTSRFFPEDDDMAHAIGQSEENTKANELLFRRLSVEDVIEAVLKGLELVPQLGFDTFIISAPMPFKPSDCAQLINDAPSVVARLFPHYREFYDPRGWTMFQSIDRVYDASKAERILGFRAKGFSDLLERLAGKTA